MPKSQAKKIKPPRGQEATLQVFERADEVFESISLGEFRETTKDYDDSVLIGIIALNVAGDRCMVQIAATILGVDLKGVNKDVIGIVGEVPLVALSHQECEDIERYSGDTALKKPEVFN